jgi:hypothetical protein
MTWRGQGAGLSRVGNKALAYLASATKKKKVL